MLFIVTALLALPVVFLALPTLVDVLTIVALPFTRRPARAALPAQDAPLAQDPPHILFLVPAHNEELLLGRTIESLRAVEYPRDRVRVVVIADNCTDRTAAIARECGAECLERFDDVERGKPYAIRWALQQLHPLTSEDAVVILDADSIVSPNFCREIAAAGSVRTRVFQSYGDVSNAGENALTHLAAVFSASRFLVMNGLKARAGLNVPLVNGTVFGADVLARHGWPALSITENWEMYALLTAYGVEIAGLPEARNYAQEARTLDQSAPQRQRWAAGKLNVLFKTAPVLLRSRATSWHQKIDACAELLTIGPVVHVSLAALLSLAIAPWPLPGRVVLLSLLAASVLRQVVYAALAVPLAPHPWRTVRALGYLPLYALWRTWVQLKVFASVRSTAWVRTARHAEP